MSYTSAAESAIIIAGGLGTRLSPYTQVVPKPLLPVGNETMLERQIAGFVAHGVTEIHIAVCYLPALFKAMVTALSPRVSASISIIEETSPRGTFGSVVDLCSAKHAAGDQRPVLVTNADVVADAPWTAAISALESNSLLTAITKEHRYHVPYGVAEIENGQLCAIREKPDLTCSVLTGMYVVRPAISRYFEARSGPIGVDVVIQTLLAHGQRVQTVSHRGRWLDAGTLDDLLRAKKEFIENGNANGI